MWWIFCPIPVDFVMNLVVFCCFFLGLDVVNFLSDPRGFRHEFGVFLLFFFGFRCGEFFFRSPWISTVNLVFFCCFFLGLDVVNFLSDPRGFQRWIWCFFVVFFGFRCGEFFVRSPWISSWIWWCFGVFFGFRCGEFFVRSPWISTVNLVFFCCFFWV